MRRIFRRRGNATSKIIYSVQVRAIIYHSVMRLYRYNIILFICAAYRLRVQTHDYAQIY